MPGALLALARQVLRLNPDRQNPEAFLIAKDEVAAELRRLAGRIRSGR